MRIPARMLRAALAMAVSVGIASPPAWASGAGSTAVPFLKIPVHARAAALGGSFAAVSGDVGTMEFNPAGLSGTNRPDIAASYIDYFEGASLQSLAVAFPLEIRDSAGADALQENQFSKDHLYLGLQYRQFRVEDDRRDILGTKSGQFAIRDSALQAAVAYPFTASLSVGASVKFIQSKLESASASAYAADGGILYRFAPHWNVGASVENLGPAVTFDGKGDPLPTQARAGLAYEGLKTLWLTDAAGGRDGVVRPSTGLEYRLNRYFAFRGGVFHQTVLGFTGGVGIGLTGPSKVAPTRRPAVASPPPGGATPTRVVPERAGRVALALGEQYRSMDIKEPTPIVAVFPFSSDERRVGALFSDAVRKVLAKDKSFAVLDDAAMAAALSDMRSDAGDQTLRAARKLEADYSVTGSVQRRGDKYDVEVRLIELKQGRTVATTETDLPADAFVTPKTAAAAHARHAIGSEPEASSRSSRDNEEPRHRNVDLGLDYAVSTDPDLGLVHRILFRLIY